MAAVVERLHEELELVLGGSAGRLNSEQRHLLRAALVEASELLSLIEGAPSSPTEPAAASPAVPADSDRDDQHDGSIRVLIADDEDNFTQMLEEMLAAEDDLTVVARARNGEEAVELTNALSPDVVLMDLNMPVMGGIDATRLISESDPSAAVVILTGLDIAGDSDRAREAGAVGYVRKVRISEDLVDAILTGVESAASPALVPGH
jgi:CheY-like chemotaxis protein